jgi:acyl-CoA thioester hydrolase
MDDEQLTRADFPVLRATPTRWGDNDQYGHANNVVYYAWFDTAVNGWLMEATGSDVSRLDAIGVVVESSCRYLSPVGFPQQLTVGLAVDRLGGRSVAYRLAVFGPDDEHPAAVGRFVHVYVDAGTRRPVDVPELVRRAVEQITA